MTNRIRKHDSIFQKVKKFCYIKEDVYICIDIVQNFLVFNYFEHN